MVFAPRQVPSFYPEATFTLTQSGWENLCHCFAFAANRDRRLAVFSDKAAV
jgi:hypothetical protein